jgi:hypothetical protein
MTGQEFEEGFAALLARARELPTLLMEQAAHGLDPAISGDDFPVATVLRMQHWANVEFEGAVALLADEMTSPAAEVLLRALLEACAHLHFIASGVGQTERACRAIRTEWGMATGMLNMGRKFAGIEDEARAKLMNEGKRREQFLQAEHSRLKCKGGRRDYGDVGSVLKEMVAEEPTLDWALDLYMMASSVAHQFMPDRILRDVGGGHTAFVAPPPSERAARFDHILVSYGLLGQRYFQVVKEGQRPDGFLVALQGLRDEALVHRAMTGDFDR